MTLSTHESIRRFLMHVLSGGFHRIRHYGLLASGSRAAKIAGARAARRSVPFRTARCLRGPSSRRTPHPATTAPLLRRTHVHHRDLRARQRAKAPTHACADRDQDRHLMMLSSLIQRRTEARHFGRLSPGSTPACADQQHYRMSRRSGIRFADKDMRRSP
jgi:hypothetical protein